MKIEMGREKVWEKNERTKEKLKVRDFANDSKEKEKENGVTKCGQNYRVRVHIV